MASSTTAGPRAASLRKSGPIPTAAVTLLEEARGTVPWPVATSAPCIAQSSGAGRPRAAPLAVVAFHLHEATQALPHARADACGRPCGGATASAANVQRV
jgi:hypothetical protein